MFQLILKSIKMSFGNLLTNKVRSFLTMLGIIIGVGAVIVIMSVGAGAQSLILAQVKSLGTNLISVVPGHSEEGDMTALMMGFTVTTLTYEDAKALDNKERLPQVLGIVAYSNGFGTLSWKSESYETTLSGATAGYLEAEGGEVKEGRFFNEEEEKNLSRLVVLGSAVKRELFGQSEAVGQRIKIKNSTFEVIGVMEERGVVAMQDYDDQVFIPIKTNQRMLGVNHVGLVRLKVDKEENIQEAMEEIKAILRERHNVTDASGKDDDFTVSSSVQALDMIKSVTDALKYFLAAMAALSLIVGGIGIMNIMLISVTERTKEIGLRKAIGASNKDILAQFLFEAVAITMMGGIAGIGLGVLISFLIAFGAQFMGYDWVFAVPPLSILLALTITTSVGVIFGLYPALKASRLDPIVALKYE